MMSHAASVNGKRFDRRLKEESEAPKPKQQESPDFDNMTSEEWARHLAGKL